MEASLDLASSFCFFRLGRRRFVPRRRQLRAARSRHTVPAMLTLGHGRLPFSALTLSLMLMMFETIK